jgi:hypothetical protein
MQESPFLQDINNTFLEALSDIPGTLLPIVFRCLHILEVISRDPSLLLVQSCDIMSELFSPPPQTAMFWCLDRRA